MVGWVAVHACTQPMLVTRDYMAGKPIKPGHAAGYPTASSRPHLSCSLRAD